MELEEAIVKRRSVKKFDPEHRLSDAQVERLISLAMLSPTAFNIQNWRFLGITDPQLRAELRKVSWDQSQVTDASIFILIAADLKSWDRDPERYWRHIPEFAKIAVPAMGQYYRGKDRVQRDEAMRSAGIAAQTLMLAAKGMGLDSCPMTGFDFDAAASLVKLPKDYCLTMAVAVGRAMEPPLPRGGSLPLAEVYIKNRFP